MIKNCVVCQREFVTYPSKILLGRGKYCSKACSDSVTLIKRGQRIGIATEIKKGDKLALGIKKESVWNSGTKGLCKPNITRFKQGEHRNPETEFKKGTPIEQHPRWLGGVSFEPYPVTFNNQLKEKIRCRDNYKCQMCGIPELETGKRSDVHHIDYVKENINEINLISLCRPCHIKTNSNRDYWKQYFIKEVMPNARRD